MKKIISLALLGMLLSGCFFRPHKMDIEQGNIITQENAGRLHIGMTDAEVRNAMGTPVLVNLFSADRMEYIYTFQTGYKDRTQKHISLIFYHGRVKAIQSS